MVQSSALRVVPVIHIQTLGLGIAIIKGVPLIGRISASEGGEEISCGVEFEFLEELCEGWFDFLEVEVEHEVLAAGEGDLAELGVEFAGMEVEDAWVGVGGVAAEGVLEE